MFVRKVRTASGAVAVQVMRKSGRRDVLVEHVGSAHTDAELGVLLELERTPPDRDRLIKMSWISRYPPVPRGSRISPIGGPAR